MANNSLSVALQTWSLLKKWDHYVAQTFHEIKELGIYILEVSDLGPEPDLCTFAKCWREGNPKVLPITIPDGELSSKDPTEREKTIAEINGYCRSREIPHVAILDDGQIVSSAIAGFHVGMLSSDSTERQEQIGEIIKHCRILGTSNAIILDDGRLQKTKASINNYMQLLVDSANILKKNGINVFFHPFGSHFDPIQEEVETPKGKDAITPLPSPLQILLERDVHGDVGIQLDTHWLAKKEFFSPSDVYEFVEGFGVKKELFLSRQFGLHLCDVADIATGSECAIGKGVLMNHIQAWLDFASAHVADKTVILEFGHEPKEDDSLHTDEYELIAQSLNWLREQGVSC